MREPKAVAGAKRVTSDPQLPAAFHAAAAASGFPQDLLEAIAYLESWARLARKAGRAARGGSCRSRSIPRGRWGSKWAASPATTRSGEGSVKSTRGKVKYQTVRRRVPYTVIVRDERLIPQRAIHAAAVYLAGMERTFGGRDWAIFAYHCGQGCVAEMQELTRRAHGVPKDKITVPRMSFSASPASKRDSISPSSSRCSATTRRLITSGSMRGSTAGLV